MNEHIIFNLDKFKAMIHYIISKCESNTNLGRVVLYKLLYFSDFDYYEKYEVSLSGEIYIRKPRGPVPSHFFLAINELIDESKINETSQRIYDYDKFKYASLKDPDIVIFSQNELDVIDETINRLAHLYSDEISQYSHGDIPWRLADDGEPLNYEAVFYREPEYSVREYND